MHRQPDRPSGGRCPETVLSKASRPVSLGYVARVWADGPVRGNSYSTLGGGGFPFIVQELRLGHMAGETWGWNLSSAVSSPSARSFS